MSSNSGNVTELRREIKEKTIRGVYLFAGSEKFMIEGYEKSFVKAFGEGLMSVDIFEGKQTSAEAVISSLQTPSMLGGRRLVVIKDAGMLASGGKAMGEDLSDYLAEEYAVADDNAAVVLIVESEVDKRTKAFKTLNKFAKIYFFEPLKESEMIAWIKERVRRNGVSISGGTASRLIKAAGGDLGAIATEIEKLASYKTEGEITAGDIDAICAVSLEARIFDMLDAVASKNTDGAVSIYNALLDAKEQPIGILAMLYRQFSLILKSSLLLKKGLVEREIADKLNKNPYAVKVAALQARRFSENALKQAIIDCCDCDTAIKTGETDAALGVLTLILKYAGS